MVSMRDRLVTGGVLLLATAIVGASQLNGHAPKSPSADLEIFPKHFLLHPGEQIHYTVCEPHEGSQTSLSRCRVRCQEPAILRLINRPGCSRLSDPDVPNSCCALRRQNDD